MKPYRDHAGGGGITHYHTTPSGIHVTFQGGKKYRYTHRSAGVSTVQTMKRLAESGSGLHSYIAQNRPQHEGQS